MKFIKENFKLISDFEIRVINEDHIDTDILVDIDKRTLNFNIVGLPRYINSRFQFNDVKSIIFRFSKLNNICTVHFLRSIDLHSSTVNFEINYSKHYFKIIDKDYYVDFKICNKD